MSTWNLFSPTSSLFWHDVVWQSSKTIDNDRLFSASEWTTLYSSLGSFAVEILASAPITFLLFFLLILPLEERFEPAEGHLFSSVENCVNFVFGFSNSSFASGLFLGYKISLFCSHFSASLVPTFPLTFKLKASSSILGAITLFFFFETNNEDLGIVRDWISDFGNSSWLYFDVAGDTRLGRLGTNFQRLTLVGQWCGSMNLKWFVTDCRCFSSLRRWNYELD